MSGWIIAAALGSVAVTALLTLVLWRLNAPFRERAGEDGTSDKSSSGSGDVGGGQ